MHTSTAYVSVVMGSNYVTSAGSTAVAGIVFGVLLCLFVCLFITMLRRLLPLQLCGKQLQLSPRNFRNKWATAAGSCR